MNWSTGKKNTNNYLKVVLFYIFAHKSANFCTIAKKIYLVGHTACGKRLSPKNQKSETFVFPGPRSGPTVQCPNRHMCNFEISSYIETSYVLNQHFGHPGKLSYKAKISYTEISYIEIRVYCTGISIKHTVGPLGLFEPKNQLGYGFFGLFELFLFIFGNGL